MGTGLSASVTTPVRNGSVVAVRLFLLILLLAAAACFLSGKLSGRRHHIVRAKRLLALGAALGIGWFALVAISHF